MGNTGSRRYCNSGWGIWFRKAKKMTKAKARLRAKAKAAQKIEKRVANADKPAETVRPAQFDPKNSSISSPRANANGKNVSGAKRGGQARSR